jgi:hypothetical protein
MAYREVSGSTNTRDIKKEGPGAQAEGIYGGRRTFETQFGEQSVYSFTGKDGTSFGLFGFTSLNRWMEAVPTGALTRITYTGKEVVETKRGKVAMHICKVEVDDGDPTGDVPAFDPDEVGTQSYG